MLYRRFKKYGLCRAPPWENRQPSVNVVVEPPQTRVRAEDMTDSTSSTQEPKPARNRWLLLIAAYKVVQSLLFVLIGVGALRLLHKDLGDLLLHLIDHLHFNPESQFVNFLFEKAELVRDPLLVRIGAGAFCYAALGFAEGIGLYLEKIWAEYLTLLITASFLPWEIYEVLHRLTPIRISLLTINTLVLLYLLKLVVERGRRPKHPATE